MRRAPTPESGVAYLLALTLLVALTAIGIVLSELAQQERLLGTADQHRMQAVNAADSGLAVATARLLAGLPSSEVRTVFGAVPSGPVVRESGFTVGPSEPRRDRFCAVCEETDEAIRKVDHRLTSVGEVVLRRTLFEGEEIRSLARAEVEATLTLQPWPTAEPLPDPPASPPPGCAAEASARVRALLVAELHPMGCRWSSRTVVVVGRDPTTGAVCGIELSVCVLLSDWREL